MSPTDSPLYKDASQPIETRIQDLLSRMSVDEKAGQLNQLNGGKFTGPSANDPGQQAKLDSLRAGKVGAFLNVVGYENISAVQKVAVEESRLGIPLLFGYDVIHGFRTIFPIPLAESSSWNIEQIERNAEIAALEASSAGLQWTFAPMADISADIRWGRVMEGGGEDPYLAGLTTAARVRGFQKNLNKGTGVLATIKHFAAYGAVEAGREYAHVDISRASLFNRYLPPYKAGVDAGAKSIMNAFNVLDGVPVSGNRFLNVEILQKHWGFDGFLVSDWNSFEEMIAHGFAKNRKDAALKAFKGGSMIDMFSGVSSIHIPELVREGTISEQELDDVISRILRVKFELGLFENPYRFGSIQAEKTTIFSEAHRNEARKSAQESITLLKNENAALPLQNLNKLALVGRLADEKEHQLDLWKATGWHEEVLTLREVLQKQSTTVTYSAGYSFDKPLDNQELKEAIKQASRAETIILALGLSGKLAGEDRSLANPSIPENQINLARELKKLNKPMIGVVFAGRPLILTELLPYLDALVYAWIPGTETGSALVDILTGTVNPSSKTVMSFPRSIGQIPLYYNSYKTGRPKPVSGDATWTSRYRDEENTALFPFGFGLSYTTFKYGKPEVSSNRITLKESLIISVEVTNSGKKAGYEIVQLYIQDHHASLVRPTKELKDFKRIWLEVGETQRITFTITPEKLGFYTTEGRFVTESGTFSAFVGTHSEALQEIEFEIID